VQYGEGADTTNRFLTEETAAVEAELASGHHVDQLIDISVDGIRPVLQDDF
jgi:hypothetical protein